MSLFDSPRLVEAVEVLRAARVTRDEVTNKLDAIRVEYEGLTDAHWDAERAYREAREEFIKRIGEAGL